jgi:hypothetical protein
LMGCEALIERGFVFFDQSYTLWALTRCSTFWPLAWDGIDRSKTGQMGANVCCHVASRSGKMVLELGFSSVCQIPRGMNRHHMCFFFFLFLFVLVCRGIYVQPPAPSKSGQLRSWAWLCYKIKWKKSHTHTKEKDCFPAKLSFYLLLLY